MNTLSGEVLALSRVTERPNLVALSYALRHPETWPKDFVWNYHDCSTCAIGLALRLWPTLQLPDHQSVQETWIAREMAMAHRAAKRVFFDLAPRQTKTSGWIFRKTEYVCRWDLVTADDVADAIDKYLAREP